MVFIETTDQKVISNPASVKVNESHNEDLKLLYFTQIQNSIAEEIYLNYEAEIFLILKIFKT